LGVTKTVCATVSRTLNTAWPLALVKPKAEFAEIAVHPPGIVKKVAEPLTVTVIARAIPTVAPIASYS
jgi:hypothetical protein